MTTTDVVIRIKEDPDMKKILLLLAASSLIAVPTFTVAPVALAGQSSNKGYCEKFSGTHNRVRFVGLRCALYSDRGHWIDTVTVNERDHPKRFAEIMSYPERAECTFTTGTHGRLKTDCPT